MNSVQGTRQRAWVLLLAASVAACSPESDQIDRTLLSASTPNLQPLTTIVSNGDVEFGLAPWLSAGAQLKTVSTESYSGSHSLMLWQRTAAWHAVVIPLGPLEPGRRYDAQVFVKLPGKAKPSSMGLEMRSFVDGATTLRPLVTVTPAPGRWEALRGSFDHLPAPGYSGSALAITAEDPSVTFFVDNLTVSDAGPAGDHIILSENKENLNIALNGGAESGLNHWSPQSAKLENVAEPVRSGKSSVRVYGRTDVWSGPMMRFGTLHEGMDYLISVYVQLASDSELATAQLTVKSRVDGKDVFFPLAKGAIVPGKWQRLSGVFHHNNSKGLEEMYAYVEADVASAEFFVDDFSVEPAR